MTEIERFCSASNAAIGVFLTTLASGTSPSLGGPPEHGSGNRRVAFTIAVTQVNLKKLYPILKSSE